MDVSLSKTIHELLYGRDLVHMDEVLQKPSDTPQEDRILSEKAIADILAILQKEGSIWGHPTHGERDQLDKFKLTRFSTKNFTLNQTPNAWNVLLLVNNFTYVEGDDFTVDRESRQVVWKRDIELDKNFADEVYFLYHVNIEDTMKWVPGAHEYVDLATDKDIDDMIGEAPESWTPTLDSDYISYATDEEVSSVLRETALPSGGSHSSEDEWVPANEEFVSAASDEDVDDVLRK